MTIRKSSHFGILRPIRAFCESEKGSVIPLVGLAFFVIMGVDKRPLSSGQLLDPEKRLVLRVQNVDEGIGDRFSNRW